MFVVVVVFKSFLATGLVFHLDSDMFYIMTQ